MGGQQKNDRGDLQWIPPFFIVLPAMAFTVTCNKEKKHRWPGERRNDRKGGIAAGERNNSEWPCCCLFVAVTVEETEREENATGGFVSGYETKRSRKMESRSWLAGLFGLGELREERLVLW
ncbi:PREDICTED: uncharacterized protein LOC105128549 [Populus euphratica]|uniref:Uncharacterized protein LOC105128549 n=1 Tax=Populus euphratica TaxID=75702 RepID=A0AAJ6XRG7_POPEU|nr:PREDICTED: uncharacterized protein LOC105128549 [Populus euphratica]